MNQRSGREAIVRCEYTHTDNRTIYREIFLHEATKPTAPNVSVNEMLFCFPLLIELFI
ncbi:unnamed protein product [Trichobilharzia regenti]|nr:unnamed protein product [Trichobilharzia regenti]